MHLNTEQVRMRKPPETRIRRGVVVVIPEQWRGQCPSNQTMLQRKAGRITVRVKRKKQLREQADFDWRNESWD